MNNDVQQAVPVAGEMDDAAFVTDLAARLFRGATPAMGFDQGDTDRLHRIARGLTEPARKADRLGGGEAQASIVGDLVELATHNIKRSQTDFLGRMTQMLCQYAERFEDDCDLTDDDTAEAVEEISELAGLALAQWAMLVSEAPIAALAPDPTHTREAELVALVERLRTDLRHVQRNTATYRQEARKEADAANERAAEANKRADNMAEANRRMLSMFEADPAALNARGGA